MKVRTKIWGISAVVLGASAIAAVFAFLGFGKVQSEVDGLVRSNVPATLLLLNIDRDAYQAQLALERAAQSVDAEEHAQLLGEYRENADQTDDRWNQLAAVAVMTPEAMEVADRFVTLQRRWRNGADAIAQSIGQVGSDGSTIDRATLDRVGNVFSRMRSQLDILEEEHFEPSIAAGLETIQGASRGARIGMVLALSAALVLGASLAWWLAGAVGRPLADMARTANSVSRGDVGQQFTYRGDDEIGDLARAFQDLAQYLQGVASAADELAEGNLTPNINVRGERDLLGTAFLSMSRRWSDVIQQVRQAAGSMNESSARLAAFSGQIDSNADLTATQAGDASSAGIKLRESIAAITSSAAEAADVARTALATSRAANGKIEELQQSSMEIDEITRVIAGIAEQTNLLALNATIEAARAGEAGKGFAVVAGEVKELAVETARATSKITEVVKAAQERASGAAESLESVGGVIERISEIADAIAGAVEQQATMTSDITSNIQLVADAAGTTRTATVEAQGVAHQVKALADELESMLSRYSVAA